MLKLRIQILFIAFFVVYGCNQKSNSQLILGEWEFVASYDLEKDKVIENTDAEISFFAIVKPEVIELTDKEDLENKEKYFWEIKGDTLFVTSENKMNTYPIFLKELDENKLIIELNFLGETRLEFKRTDNKNATNTH